MAEISKETFAVFADDLMQFSLDDIREACQVLGRKPREHGEKAFPDVGTLISECERIWKAKREAHWQSSEFAVYQCGRCDNRQVGKAAACIACGGFTHMMAKIEKFDERAHVQDVRNHPENYFCIGELEPVLRAMNMMPGGDAR